MGMPCIIIELRRGALWNSIGSTKCLRTLGLEPCRCYGKAMVWLGGEDQSLGNCIAFAWMLLIVKYIEQILSMA